MLLYRVQTFTAKALRYLIILMVNSKHRCFHRDRSVTHRSGACLKSKLFQNTAC